MSEDQATRIEELIHELALKVVRWLVTLLLTLLSVSFSFGVYLTNIRRDIDDLRENGSIPLKRHFEDYYQMRERIAKIEDGKAGTR